MSLQALPATGSSVGTETATEERLRKTAAATRAALPPDLLVLADGIRTRFGGSLRYLETPTLTRGNPAHMTPGVTVQGDWKRPR